MSIDAILNVAGRLADISPRSLAVMMVTLSATAWGFRTKDLNRIESLEGTVLYLACRTTEGDAGRTGEACRFLLPPDVLSRLDEIARGAR